MSAVHFLSICSGIEAASQAWAPLGWQAVGFSEIDPFACAVLAHHHPRVPNFGSLTDFRQWTVDALAQTDVLVGGTPCQAFSVAGLRQSLADERGNLTLTLVHLYDHLTEIRHTAGRPAPVLVWENVPGVLNTPDNAFGCFLGGLAGEDGPLRPPGGAWHDAGYVRGPKRTIAWRVLDAQYQGLAQRRRRVFLVAGPRDGFCAEQVLFEFTGLRRDTPPRREAGEGTAQGFETGSQGGGYTDLAPTLDTRCKDGPIRNQLGCGVIAPLTTKAYADNESQESKFIPELSYAIQAGAGGSKFGSGRHNQDTFIPEVCPTLRAGGNKTGGDRPPGTDVDTCDSLIPCHPLPFDTTQITSKANRSQPQAGDPCHPLASGAHPPAIAFPERMSSTQCASTEDLSPSLQSLNPTAIAFSARARGDDGRGYDRPEQVFGEVVGTIDTMKPHNVAISPSHGLPVSPSQSPAYAVRRLTPKEYERLQGFPDDYTLIPWRGKPADLCPDGPRYKALGNSMAVPVMHWIGARLCAYLCQ